MDELLALETRIGGPHWTNNYRDNDPPQYIVHANSEDLLKWLELRGVPREKLRQLARIQLEKCYCIKNYFDKVVGNQPKNLAQTRRKGQKFHNPLDVENILKDHEEILKNSFSAFEERKAPASLNPPTMNPLSPPDFRPQDPVRELLTTIDITINQKLASLREEIKRQTTTTVAQSVIQERQMIFESIKHSLENGSIDLNISKELEKKILSLVQKTSDEVVFQALRNNPRPLGRTGEQIPATAGKGEPELNFGIDLGRETHSPTHSPSFIPTLDPKFYFDPFASRVVRKALGTGRHVYLHGPAGCGKTMLVEQVCALLGHGLFRINPHDGITREFFLGGIKLKNGETQFQDGALPTAMRQGLALLVDEFSFLPPNLAAILHPVLERNGKLFIPETGEILRSSPGFCVLATDNTGGKGDSTGQFTGTEVQNTATLDRFDYSVVMDYLPQNKEYSMIAERFPELESDNDELELRKILSLAEEVRKAFTRGELAITLSTRKLISFFEQRQQGFSLSEALSLCLLSWLDDDDRELVKTFLDRLDIKLEE